MTWSIPAIFENGILRPLRPLLGVPDKAQVDLIVNTRENGHAVVGEQNWRACIGIIARDDAAEMSRVIEDEFEKVDERDW